MRISARDLLKLVTIFAPIEAISNPFHAFPARSALAVGLIATFLVVGCTQEKVASPPMKSSEASKKAQVTNAAEESNAVMPITNESGKQKYFDVDTMNEALKKLGSDPLKTKSVLLMNDVDAASMIPFQSEIRDWCHEPNLELGVDLGKNAIVFWNFQSSIQDLSSKINEWTKNAPAGKLKKRKSNGD